MPIAATMTAVDSQGINGKLQYLWAVSFYIEKRVAPSSFLFQPTFPLLVHTQKAKAAMLEGHRKCVSRATEFQI